MVRVTHQAPLAAIFGCRGLQLDAQESQFFADVNPVGFILFQRNCDNPEQVRRLVDDLRECVGRADAPVLIDQEGGRVQRLVPPHWRKAPAATRFAKLASIDLDLAVQAAHLNARLIARELSLLGVTVDCTPVLDLPQAGSDPIIGDRAYGTDPAMVAALGRAVCEGFLAGGVLPVIKHIPGHGRADVDSHMALPVVSASVAELTNTDFSPFVALSDMPWAMTAHVVYTQIDSENPATTSANVIDVIRRQIGFTGILLSDDLSMQALSGSMGKRVTDSLSAGCDIVLHCNGKMDEMTDIADVCSTLTDAAIGRIKQAELRRLKNILPWQESAEEAVRRLDVMLEGKG